MIDIQEDVYNILKTVIDENNVYSFQPPVIFNEDATQVIVFAEIENEPDRYTDGKETTSIITYNINLYSKNPDTYLMRSEVNDKLVEYGFGRISSGQEFYEPQGQYYFRLLSYQIYKKVL